MCNKGRRQSPINVEPEKLLFDPYLRSLHIDKHKVSKGATRVEGVDRDGRKSERTERSNNNSFSPKQPFILHTNKQLDE